MLRVTPTRWNSLFRAMVRLLELKTYVMAALNSPECPHPSATITEENWTMLALLAKLLKPFAVGTDHIQMDNASLTSVNIEMQKIADSMCAFAHGSDRVLAGLARTAVDSSISNRWDDNFNSAIVMAATALDPWLRKKIGGNSEWRAKKFIKGKAIIHLRQFDDGKALSSPSVLLSAGWIGNLKLGLTCRGKADSASRIGHTDRRRI